MLPWLRTSFLIAFTALLLCACDKSDEGTGTVAAATNRSLPYLDHAQPKLPTIKLWIGPKEMVSEVARQQVELNTGMMYRTEMGTNDGMLFVMPYPLRASFYMRNTIVPLSAAYIDPEGTIIEIHDLKPKDETPVEAKVDNIQYILETPQGWFKRNNIGTGTVIRTERGSFQDTFWKR
jgi:uncharacterized membrane protein (UPF0127 family)